MLPGPLPAALARRRLGDPSPGRRGPLVPVGRPRTERPGRQPARRAPPATGRRARSAASDGPVPARARPPTGSGAWGCRSQRDVPVLLRREGLPLGAQQPQRLDDLAAGLRGPRRPLRRAEWIAAYAGPFANPYIAAERGYVDAVIVPSKTRSEIVKALRLLRTKRESLPPKKHGNIPL